MIGGSGGGRESLRRVPLRAMSGSRSFELVVGGRTLHGRLDFPSRQGAGPAILVCHGFKGFFEWGFYPPLVDLLTARGFVVARFNFSGSGMRPGDDLVTDEAAFRGATFSRDVAEARALLAALANDLAPGRVDPARIGLLGHSRGGGVAILAAAEAPPAALVTWAAVSTFHRMGEAEVDHWRRAGELPVANARTGQELAIGVEVLDDLERHASELDIVAAAARRTMPWLIVHGVEDETVSVTEGERLAAAARQPSEKLLVEGGSHTFGAAHPFGGPTPQLIEVFNATQTWFRRHLGD